MKKYLSLLLLLLIIPQAWARVLIFTTRTFDVVKPSTTINLIGTAVNYHRISWSFTGTVTTCQVKLESSANGSAWADLIANQACTTAGMATAVTGSHNYVRINMTTLTGGGTVSVTYEGFSTDPSASIGSGAPAIGNLDMNNFLVTNIGHAGTDFVAGGGLSLAGSLEAVGSVRAGAGNAIYWNTRSLMISPSNGIIALQNLAQTDFTRLQFGGTTSSFPAIARSGTGFQLQLADGTAGASLDMNTGIITNIGVAGASFTAPGGLILAAAMNIGAGNDFRWTGKTRMFSDVDGTVKFINSGNTGFDGLILGPTGVVAVRITPAAAVGGQAQGIIINRGDNTPQVFANLGAATNGSMIYCSDCTIANPCAGVGTGAIAKRLNGAWVCN